MRNSVARVCIPCGKNMVRGSVVAVCFCGHKMDYDRDYLFS